LRDNPLLVVSTSSSSRSMASSRAARGANKTLLQLYPQLQQGIVQARRDILGHLPPPTGANARTGYSKIATKQLTEVYHDQYYMEPIDKIARQVRCAAGRERRKKGKRVCCCCCCYLFMSDLRGRLAHPFIPCSHPIVYFFAALYPSLDLLACQLLLPTTTTSYDYRSNLDFCGTTRNGDASSSCSYDDEERDRPKRARAVKRKSRHWRIDLKRASTNEDEQICFFLGVASQPWIRIYTPTLGKSRNSTSGHLVQQPTSHLLYYPTTTCRSVPHLDSHLQRGTDRLGDARHSVGPGPPDALPRFRAVAGFVWYCQNRRWRQFWSGVPSCRRVRDSAPPAAARRCPSGPGRPPFPAVFPPAHSKRPRPPGRKIRQRERPRAA
jgi:hypothetical protein